MNPRRIVRLYEWYKVKTFCCAFFAAAMLTMVAAATMVRFPPVRIYRQLLNLHTANNNGDENHNNRSNYNNEKDHANEEGGKRTTTMTTTTMMMITIMIKTIMIVIITVMIIRVVHIHAHIRRLKQCVAVHFSFTSNDNPSQLTTFLHNDLFAFTQWICTCCGNKLFWRLDQLNWFFYCWCLLICQNLLPCLVI